jgi:alkanesulfonate monooxygenase SsuD/methylene tetrahydromethanopterin reductase-like flavin-dependent oxidoreductase (luciferase family)
VGFAALNPPYDRKTRKTAMHVGMTTFFQNLGRPISDRAVYAHEMSMADLAEPLGFDSIWGAEHHFDDYTMCPNVAQFLTYMAGRTKRVKLASMVMVLPWHDPVRLAEEISVLDTLSGGRVILGIGRGLGRVEFRGFRVPMAESRGRFTEYAQALLQGLETGSIEFDGEHYHQPRVAVRPAPIASFRDRTYAASVSPQSLEIMCRLGVGLLIIAQKPWETTEAELRDYRSRFLEVNGRAAPKPLIASFIAVHEHEAVARDMFDKYIRGYARSALDHYEFHNEGLADIPGYEYYGKLASNIRKHGIDAFVNFLAELQVWGTPDQVFQKLAEHQRRADISGLIGAFSYGGMPHDLAKRNITLFAERVLPRLQAIDVGCDVGGGAPLTVAAE